MNKYVTTQGDTWDLIAYKLYGTEIYMGDLMHANRELLDTLIFNDGVVLNVPEIEETETAESAPFWRY